MFVAWQGPFRIMFFFTKKTPFDGITRVGAPCVEQVFAMHLKMPVINTKERVHNWSKPT